MIHLFDESLARSHEIATAPFWDQIYRQAFPTMVGSRLVLQDGWMQRSGVDRLIDLASGKSVLVEEKVRKEAWADILFEFYSDERRKHQGWIAKDSQTDYLAYVLLPTKQCYLFDFGALRRLWYCHRRDWVRRGRANMDGFKIVRAPNRNYTTTSVAVPIERLLTALAKQTCIAWVEEPVVDGP